MTEISRSNPFKRVINLVLTETGAKPVTLVVLLCGMVVTYMQYQSHIDNTRIEKSFQMVEEWELRGYKDDFGVYSEAVLAFEAKALAEDWPPLPYIQRQLSDPIGREANRDVVASLYYFFDKMALCVEQNLCDGTLLEGYFGTSVRGFWENTVLYLSNRRKRVSDFGVYTERFAKSVTAP